jgi:effector-binding domain-containing protein
MAYQIQVREVSSQPALSIRAVVHTLELVRFFDEATSEIRTYLNRAGVRAVGPPRSLWHSAPGEIPDSSDIETCLPIEHPVPSSGRMRSAVLPAGLQAFTVHYGAYDEMVNAFDAVWQWIQEHGYEMVGPPCDVVLVGPNDTSDPSAYRTEIVYPVSALKQQG